jgi:hypothetical protein
MSFGFLCEVFNKFVGESGFNYGYATTRGIQMVFFLLDGPNMPLFYHHEPPLIGWQGQKTYLVLAQKHTYPIANEDDKDVFNIPKIWTENF